MPSRLRARTPAAARRRRCCDALATVVPAPAAIAGSVGAGVLGSAETTLLVLAFLTACAAAAAALELVHRRHPLPA